MAAQTTTIQIPQNLYRRLQRMAELTRHSLDEVVARTLETSVPPLPESWPEEMRQDLLALESLSDEALWQVARSQVSPERHEEHSRLLEKNRAGTLAEGEKAALAVFRKEADQLMLRKAYAYVLLKWRGHRLPTLAELESAA
ncbi:MAG: hypothetical protein HY260_00755 [Chloroflexi bacterium]|nr:hypothetical protein [Chloroflexota bacterium]